MTFRQVILSVVERVRICLRAFSFEHIVRIMSHFDPTRVPDYHRNGEVEDPADDSAPPLHGGAADGLPVAGRRPIAGSPQPASPEAAAELDTLTPPISEDAPGTHDGGPDAVTAKPAPAVEIAGTGTLDEGADGGSGREDESVPTEDISADIPAGFQTNGVAAVVAGDEKFLAMGDGQVALSTVLESLLFVAGEPVEINHLTKTLSLPVNTIEQGLGSLAERYKQSERGLRLQVHKGRYQLVTAPALAQYVEEFLNLDISTKLSSAALETLAVVAYRQPVTRIQIEAIRGVDSAGVLRSLSHRGLVEEVGRLETVGRPILYGVTELFMQHFGLMELGDLPPLAAEDADLLHATAMLADHDEPADDDKDSESNHGNGESPGVEGQ